MSNSPITLPKQSPHPTSTDRSLGVQTSIDSFMKFRCRPLLLPTFCAGAAVALIGSIGCSPHSGRPVIRESSPLKSVDRIILPVVHEVKRGESISSLALRYYGPDRREEGATAIKKANPQIIQWESRPLSAEPKLLQIPALPFPPM